MPGRLELPNLHTIVSDLFPPIYLFSRMLNCGHSFCEKCLTLMLPKDKSSEIQCPSCQNTIQLQCDLTKNKGSPEYYLSKLIKNYALISLVES